MPGPSALAIEVVSDVVCPWCYIGKRRLAKALALLAGEVQVRVAWLPFQLNPGMPRAGMARAEYRRAKFGSFERGRELDAHVAAEGSREGITFAFERIARTPNTLAAHQLIELAQQRARGDAVVDALFRAYFEEGRDVGDAAVLLQIARACEIEDREVESRWADQDDARRVLQLESEMRSLGIDAVPTFVFDRRTGVSGAHPPEALAAAIRAAAQHADGPST
ncbi:MAG: DsbA family oxidoreductase [Betaproteobacteria bacterium]|nr:DsbA family oxidoreductase [Betaproteobacteria bacterium]